MDLRGQHNTYGKEPVVIQGNRADTTKKPRKLRTAMSLMEQRDFPWFKCNQFVLGKINSGSLVNAFFF